MRNTYQVYKIRLIEGIHVHSGEGGIRLIEGIHVHSGEGEGIHVHSGEGGGDTRALR